MDGFTRLQTPLLPDPSSPLSSLRSSPPHHDLDLLDEYPCEDNEETPLEAGDDLLTRQARRLIKKKAVLKAVVDVLRLHGFSFAAFLETWIEEPQDGQDQVLLEHRLYRNPSQRRSVFYQVVGKIPLALDLSTDELLQELRQLTTMPQFGSFDAGSATPADIDLIDFTTTSNTIMKVAPTWHRLLTRLLPNQRTHRNSYSTPIDDSAISRVEYTLLSIICHSRARKTSNYLASILGVYLMGSGTKRRVLEVLSGLGLCSSYHTINRAMDKLASTAKLRIKELALDPQTVIVYDNINFKDTKRDEILGSIAVMQALTTAAIIRCPQLPRGGLRQDMHNPSIKLDYMDILRAPGINGDDKGLSSRITRAHIAEAICSVHASGVTKVFHKSTLYPQMPQQRRIPHNQTEFWQLGAIYANEGTISGTYSVHNEIYGKYLGLYTADLSPTQTTPHFKERLHLVFGDQLTAHHIRSVKAEQSQATLDYDRRNWMLGIPAWFHVQMNLLGTIVRTHFGPLELGQEAPHCLEADISTLGRSPSTRESFKYHVIAPLVAQSFAARVLALFYTAMEKRGYLRDTTAVDLEKDITITTIIEGLCPNQFLELVADVELSAFTPDAWDGVNQNGNTQVDRAFTTMCRMLQEIELFLTIRHAIKYGDIGLLQHLVDPLIVFFLGASQWNYSNEMLFYRWNLSSVNTTELQDAILSAGLVNWLGRESTHKPIDLGLEHLNGMCKINMKCYKNSTHNVDMTFNRVCLTNTWVRHIAGKLEIAFGEYMSGAHSTKSACHDIFNLAMKLVSDNLARPLGLDQQSNPAVFESEDIKHLGIMRLADQVSKFNSEHVLLPGLAAREYLSKAGPACVDLEGDIQEYAENFDERFDDVLDATFSLDSTIY